MALRNTSGKFNIPGFGRKNSEGPASPARANGEDASSPHGREPSGSFAGLGNKLGKTIAHQSIIPSLGNQDNRLLQDIITQEKGVLAQSENLAAMTSKAAAALGPYGQQEGPDLQDVLTHSSTLLEQLSRAFNVYADHTFQMRSAFKRIREREEELEESRRRRRNTGAKAETAEKKLAKMGPENKALPQQTELLERLRQEMRQMDVEIVGEESKLGDFKRQMLKEAMSLKFGGLEELGEKMCIIGELGKLLLEEIPLEETPPGYNRAPYTGYEKTESAVNEANKCLATVKFHAGSSAPKAPGLPPHIPTERITTPQMPPADRLTAAEEFAHYPGDAQSPEVIQIGGGKGRDYSLDDANPYGGISNPYGGVETGTGNRGHAYGEYGGSRGVVGEHGQGGQVVWQGPTDEALHGLAPPIGAGQNGGEAGAAGRAHNYEYEQQAEMDKEEQLVEAAWREEDGSRPVVGQQAEGESQDESRLQRPWEPLNVRRDKSTTPDPARLALSNGVNGSGGIDFSMPPSTSAGESDGSVSQGLASRAVSDHPTLVPPPPIGLGAGADSMATTGIPSVPSTPEPNERDFHTPLEGPVHPLTPVPDGSPLPPSHQASADASAGSAMASSAYPSVPHISTVPAEGSSVPPPPIVNSPASFSPVPVGGKISAAAFRRGAKPRTSLDPEDSAHSGNLSPDTAYAGGSGPGGARRLPLPPAMPGALGPGSRSASPVGTRYPLPASPSLGGAEGRFDHGLGVDRDEDDNASFNEAKAEHEAPPLYGDESLR